MLNLNSNKNNVRQISIARSWLDSKVHAARSNRHDSIALVINNKEYVFKTYTKALKHLVEMGFAEVWVNIPARRGKMFKDGYEDIVLTNGSIVTIYPLGN